MIISFGWTTPALLAGAKTVTRRDWAPIHARRFKAGMLVDAWNTSPRNVKGKPRKIATIRLTEDAHPQWTPDVPGSDYRAEGFVWLHEHGLQVDGVAPPALWSRWLHEPRLLYVVRFEVVEVMT